MATQIEVDIAHEIMRTIAKLQLPFMLDTITEGRGNCFPLAVIAQCRRKDIFRNLTPKLQLMVRQNDSNSLRLSVMKFMMSSKHENIIAFQTRYNNVVAPIDGRNWVQYWEIMARNYEWVDYIFVQATAWLLQHDIVIISTTGTEKDPYVMVSGNIENELVRCPFPPLILGCKSNSHYQSLLPTTEWINIHRTFIKPNIEKAHKQELSNCRQNIRHSSYAQSVMPVKDCELNGSNKIKKTGTKMESKSESKQNQRIQPMINMDDNDSQLFSFGCLESNMVFNYSYEDQKIDVRIISRDQIECPFCLKILKNILNHFKKGKCKMPSLTHFAQALQNYKAVTFMDQLKENNRQRQRKFVAKQRTADEEKVKKIRQKERQSHT